MTYADTVRGDKAITRLKACKCLSKEQAATIKELLDTLTGSKKPAKVAKDG